MARPSSPFWAQEYYADSESSDFDYDFSASASSRPSSMKSNQKLHKLQQPRRVTVRTPSEEDLYNQNKQLDYSRRNPAPYSFSRHSSYSDEEYQAHQARTEKDKKREKREKQSPVTAATPNPAGPGVQPYNNPAGSTPQLCPNAVFIHNTGQATPNGYFPGQQPFAVNPAQATQLNPRPYGFQAIHFAGQQQPSPHIVNNGGINPNASMPQSMGYYQNSVPVTPGVHYQPQTPDTTFGPMHHTYVPRFDGGPAVIAQPSMPGIVCHSGSLLVPYLPSSYLPPPVGFQPQVNPITFAAQPVYVASPSVPMCSTFIASAPVMTMWGRTGDGGTAAPRDVVVR